MIFFEKKKFFLFNLCFCASSSLKENDIAILVGTSLNNETPQMNNVKRIIMNPAYDRSTQDYDVAVLELNTPLVFSERVQPIPLANENNTIPDNSMCLVTGWGETNRFIFFGRHRLRGVEVPIVNQQTCNNDYESVGGVTPRMLCAGFRNGGKDSCQGDSGGPLACQSQNYDGNLTLYGIVSFGIECARPKLPGVYTRIEAVQQWIHNIIGLKK